VSRADFYAIPSHCPFHDWFKLVQSVPRNTRLNDDGMTRENPETLKPQTFARQNDNPVDAEKLDDPGNPIEQWPTNSEMNATASKN
jgi:hypothetical protein